MRRGRFLICTTVLAAAAALLVVPAALGASSRQIYADYADNGRLNGTYSAQELRAALKDAWVQGYGHPTVVVGVKGAVHAAMRNPKAGRAELASGVAAAPAEHGRTLPFTGFDLGLLLGGGLALLVVGGSLRRLAGSKR